jgi:hypothetical protein
MAVEPSPKQRVYQELLAFTLPMLRNRETLPWWRRMRSWYGEAELVHNLYDKIVDPDFSPNDIYFLNCQARNYMESGKSSPLYSNHVRRIRKLFVLVPDDLRDMLDWKGPRPNTDELFEAIEAGDAGKLQALLDEGADPNDVPSLDFSPLIRAADDGRADLVALLLKAGAGANHDNDSGDNPLICAVVANSIESVRLLLAAGADPRRPSYLGASALKYAEGKPEILALLERGK